MADEKQWERAEAHWREHHAKQGYADKNLSYEDYAAAYRYAWETASKHAGKKFEEIEDEVALGYEKARPGDPLPWDTVRPAVKAEWDRLAGVITPRDTDRGIRSGL
jgi:hypothetical protein